MMQCRPLKVNVRVGRTRDHLQDRRIGFSVELGASRIGSYCPVFYFLENGVIFFLESIDECAFCTPESDGTLVDWQYSLISTARGSTSEGMLLGHCNLIALPHHSGLSLYPL
jgi:hypothetical protein